MRSMKRKLAGGTKSAPKPKSGAGPALKGPVKKTARMEDRSGEISYPKATPKGKVKKTGKRKA